MAGLQELSRFDFTPGPTSADCIENGLWLGNLSAAVDKEFLESIKCNHILTVDSCPLPRNIISLPGMTSMYIQLTDMPHEDILSNFDNTYKFISEGQLSGVVLVHCYFGVSRSCSVVIAFLMKKYCISYPQALDRVKAKRSTVGPNNGFINQLRLYEKMGYSIDRKLLDWRLFRMRIASEFMTKVKILPTDCNDVIRPDPALVTAKPDPLVYKCYHCRRIIANKSNIIPHVAGKKVTWTNPQSFSSHNENILCKEYLFCEPLAWMKLNSVEGKLNCPKCQSKLGSFNWVMGTYCVCKARMVPCFYFIPSKIELCNIIQNVEAII
ncbi:dual specificity protein phosphatase MPK-4 [Halyomorpha halys]|uniref:dual specificity protein phosphatase MPK-4 n=1 Tax=Halyomorpha halys TaxID=286706 RepID=UPI0006D4F874